ncbi:MAG: hypothetical protein JWN76_1045 [Chitinophagaceae bacterium]|nr:hypothetical protein [Chitinophagaceae bacterium]
MKSVLFLSRVTFILNLVFIVFILNNLQLFNFQNQYVRGFVITAGFFIALLFNTILQLLLLTRMLAGRSSKLIPVWLVATNLIIFIVQVIFFFY